MRSVVLPTSGMRQPMKHSTSSQRTSQSAKATL
jgi:hypothetical protein